MGAVGRFFRSLAAELTPGCPCLPAAVPRSAAVDTPAAERDCIPLPPPDQEADPIEEARQRRRDDLFEAHQRRRDDLLEAHQRRRDALRAVNDALIELNVASRRLREAETVVAAYSGAASPSFRVVRP